MSTFQSKNLLTAHGEMVITGVLEAGISGLGITSKLRKDLAQNKNTLTLDQTILAIQFQQGSILFQASLFSVDKLMCE